MIEKNTRERNKVIVTCDTHGCPSFYEGAAKTLRDKGGSSHEDGPGDEGQVKFQLQKKGWSYREGVLICPFCVAER